VQIAARNAATETGTRALGAISAPAQLPTESDATAQAERYALIHRKRAALIRRHGGLPDRREIGRVPPGVVQAIVTGTTPNLCALDRASQRPAAPDGSECSVIPGRRSRPGTQGHLAQRRHWVPALRFASAGMTRNARSQW
jgi:hypothetical protein